MQNQSHAGSTRTGWLYRAATALLALAVLAGCSDELQPPVAVIDAPATAFVGDVVELDGSNSYDPGGASIAFAWGFLGIPPGSQATLNNPALINPSFTADVAGTYTVILVVDNGEVPSVAVSADIVVQACGGQRPLVASIAADPATPGVGETVR
ncbi:MAG: hypothetical protein JW797_04945, partial [Bradymonadales bacterium]|nr:hypothetical protein [Bradymonadales bacterium]